MNLRIVFTFFLKSVLLIVCTTEQITSASCDTCMYSEKVTTYIDASTQLVDVKNIITVSNNNLIDPVKCYIYTIDPLWRDHLSNIEAQDSKGLQLSVNSLPVKNSLLQFNITFQNYILEGESNTITVHSIYTHYLKSFPRSVKQSEQHLVLFSFNVYFYSESSSKEQSTFVNIGTNKLVSVDGEKYSTMHYENGYLFKYGPYFDIPTFSKHLSIIHYNNKSPFLTVEELDRYILLSHWGYANVWQKVLLVHSGPKFMGPYERPAAQDSSVQDTRIEWFTAVLPKNAFNIYVKDDIGLVWSYEIHDADMHNTLVTIRPRFIMYGGWKTQFEIGYTVPISNYLRYSESSYFNIEFYFDFPFIDLVFQHLVIDKAQINFILPEGARFRDIYPYNIANISDIHIHKYCYFLDVSCRQLISFKRYNLVEKHRSNILMTYVYPRIFILLKPFAISICLLMLFMTFIVITRLKTHSPAYSQQLKALKPTYVKMTSNEPSKKGQQTTVKKKNIRKC